MPTRSRKNSPHQRLIDGARPYYEAMLAAQQGRCALCKKLPSETRRFDIDHDHKAMYVRGLLCHRCNRILVSWLTSEWLRDAADFLERGPMWFELIKKNADKE